MELVTEPEIYSPSMDDSGNYIDKIPSFFTVKYGLRCPCGSRKDKVYDTHGVFAQHVKTKAHQKWLESVNSNKSNYFLENESLRETVQQQRIMIAKLEKDVHSKIMTINFLSQQLACASASASQSQDSVNNLLEFD
jgi:hypothetical protein